MRKFLCFTIVFSVLFSLCGCASAKPITSKTEQYTVASLGFERENDKLRLFVEAIVVGTEGTSKAEPRLISGEGENIEKAFSSVSKKISQPLLLSHCAVVVLGSSLKSQDYAKIFDYCLKKRDITISAFAVITDNAETLLNMSPVSSVAVGYDIVGMIEQQKENFKNRIYEIEAEKYKGKSALIPVIKIEGEEFYYEKALFYKNGRLSESEGGEI